MAGEGYSNSRQNDLAVAAVDAASALTPDQRRDLAASTEELARSYAINVADLAPVPEAPALIDAPAVDTTTSTADNQAEFVAAPDPENDRPLDE